MPRQNATNYTSPEISNVAYYHGGNFETLCFYNSDRKIKANSNYTVSEDNSPSTLKLVKVGQHMNVFGIELENVSTNLRSAGFTTYANVLDLIFDKAGFDSDFFKIEQDSTVDTECITQTFTKSWLRNNYKSFKAMYELFERFGITTNSTKCGMHVNIDLSNFGKDYETQVENARKLGYLINKHYDFFRNAFYRPGSVEWCGRMSTSKEYWKNTPTYDFSGSHGNCYNASHIREHRVEIRLVGGQKNYPCFRNTMETVFFIVNRVGKLSWDDLDDLTKVFKGCNNYVFDRISTNCFRANTITLADVEKIRPTVKDERFL